ncbi:MAG: hypothetical protein KBH41_18000 [Azonexus sp.]|nr:hypothetical protein [Azonexus sp.]
MNKAQETKSRRAAALAILGEGWKAYAGIEGARDMYKTRNVIVMPQRTVDGNFYVGSRRGFCYTATIEQAAEIANSWKVS